jgi:hypothetical protein
VLPEEKIAQWFLADANIRPPIDIRAEVGKLAEIREIGLPVDADAVLLGHSPKRQRPLLLLQSNAAATRRTFTLAHELGHIVIPWHAGTFVCNTDLHIRVPNYIYRETETEANRFASEVLMPTSWIRQIAAKSTTIVGMIRELQQSGVSSLAATIALSRKLSPGYVYAEVDPSERVTFSGRSPDTHMSAPALGSVLNTDSLDALATNHETIATAAGLIHWWHLGTLKRSLPKLNGPDSRSILDDILHRVASTAEERRVLAQSVNGIVGAANGKAKASNRDLYTILRARFEGREKLRRIIADSAFDSFLVQKAHELDQRVEM